METGSWRMHLEHVGSYSCCQIAVYLSVVRSSGYRDYWRTFIIVIGYIQLRCSASELGAYLLISSIHDAFSPTPLKSIQVATGTALKTGKLYSVSELDLESAAISLEAINL